MLTLPLSITGIVLLAALLHAIWNAFVKIGEDRLIVMAMFNITGLIMGWAVIPFVGLPAPAAWPFIIASSVLHTGYYFFLIRAYDHGDLSQIYPLARGASPILIALGAAFAAGEWLNTQAIIGLGVACAGIISLAFEKGLPWRHNTRAVLFALGTSLFIAAYTLTDGTGVRVAGEPLAYIAWLIALDGIPLIIYTAWTRRTKLSAALHRHWRIGSAAGLASTAAYGLVIWAMALAPMAMVSAVRETSVIFAALIGAVILRERFGLVRGVATVLVVAGVCMLQLSA